MAVWCMPRRCGACHGGVVHARAVWCMPWSPSRSVIPGPMEPMGTVTLEHQSLHRSFEEQKCSSSVSVRSSENLRRDFEIFREISQKFDFRSCPGDNNFSIPPSIAVPSLLPRGGREVEGRAEGAPGSEEERLFACNPSLTFAAESDVGCSDSDQKLLSGLNSFHGL